MKLPQPPPLVPLLSPPLPLHPRRSRDVNADELRLETRTTLVAVGRRL
jgi:hypothetical protein